MLTRRGFIITAVSLLAAPAIVRASSLMPISVQPPVPPSPYYLTNFDEPTWIGGYEPLPTLNDTRLRIVGKMEPGPPQQLRYNWNRHLVDTRDNPALDDAIAKAFRGETIPPRDRIAEARKAREDRWQEWLRLRDERFRRAEAAFERDRHTQNQEAAVEMSLLKRHHFRIRMGD